MTTNHHTPHGDGDTANATNLNAPLSSLDSAISGIIAGTTALTAPDINGGTIDNAAIGGTTPAAVAATTLSASGAVSFDSTFDLGGAIHVHRNGVAQTIATATTTTIQWTNEEGETGWFDTGTYRFTPQIAGRYMAHASVLWAASVDQSFHQIAIDLNGGALAVAYYRSSGTGSFTSQVTTRWYSMNGSTDYFSVSVAQTTGGNVNVDGNANLTYFDVWRIG